MNNVMSTIKFMRLSNGNYSLTLSNFYPKMSKLIFYSTQYAKNSNLYSKYKDKIDKFSNVQPVNPELIKIQGFNRVDKMNHVNISLKPFAYMPSKAPLWLGMLGLNGVWWILNIPNISDCLSVGQCLDICNSLTILEETRKKTDHLFTNNWYYSMKSFFTDAFVNKSIVRIIVGKK